MPLHSIQPIIAPCSWEHDFQYYGSHYGVVCAWLQVGLNIVYCVTAGKSLHYVWIHTCHKHGLSNTCDSFGLSAWIVVYAGVQILLSQVRVSALGKRLSVVHSVAAPLCIALTCLSALVLCMLAPRLCCARYAPLLLKTAMCCA